MFSDFQLFLDPWIKSALCFVISFSSCFLAIKKYIKYVHENGNLFQPIRDDGPKEHLKKVNTPTIAGFFIIISTLLSCLLFIDLSNHYIWTILLVFISFGAIGLYDDLVKILKKDTQGLRGCFKIIIQFFIVGVVYLILAEFEEIHLSGNIFLPDFFGFNLILPLSLYILFCAIVIVGSANAVNLTDGLDGLVSIPAIINLIALSALAIIAACPLSASKYGVVYINKSGEILYFCISLIGALLAFLKFNFKPAKIFMGDVGSLAIGASLGLIAIILKQEFIFFVISLLFVFEALSVIIQVGSYKIRKKRIFLMAPIHHHFEKLGWSETKVVYSFWIASLIFALVGMSFIAF